MLKWYAVQEARLSLLAPKTDYCTTPHRGMHERRITPPDARCKGRFADQECPGIEYNLLEPEPGLLLSRCPPPCHVHPFIKTASLLPLDIDNVSITFAPASNSVLFDRIPRLPVLVFFFPLLFILGSRLEEWRSCQLSVARGICWAMLYCGVPVSDVPEVMYVLGS